MLQVPASHLRQLSLVAILLTSACDSNNGQPQPQTRTYYVAADDVEWDYVPGGLNSITGEPDMATMDFVRAGKVRVSTVYRKTLYRDYTDSTFTVLNQRPLEWRHLGFLGPVLRGVVGDTIRVVFRNHSGRPFSVHPHGVFYNKDSEGAPYVDGTSAADKADDGVPPGGTHVYLWPVPERAGPGPMDGSSVIWMYHSHTDEEADVNTGLLGPMIVTARARARADGSPSDVDRELVTAFAQTQEDDSWFYDDTLRARIPLLKTDRPEDELVAFSHYTINGFNVGSLPLEWLTVRRNERVRWYVFASTNFDDTHAPHWHGNTVTIGGMRTDVASLNAMEMVVADMTPDNPGTWLFHCHVGFHILMGMTARYHVE